jgi:sulfite exporter TauE/SafE
MAIIFVASLLGSLHCAGMCGGLVALAVAPTPGRSGLRSSIVSRIGLHAAYHGGRLVAYVALGLAAGAIGTALQQGGELTGFQHTAGRLSGVLLIAFALVGVLRAIGARIPGIGTPLVLKKVLAGFHQLAGRHVGIPRSAAIGVLSACLPCGWLYMFVLAAAGTGHVATGGAVMAAFWAGSVPVLIGVGAGAQALQHLLGRHLPMVMSLMILVVGIWTAAGRLALPDLAGQLSPPSVGAAQGVPASQPPCCRKHDH